MAVRIKPVIDDSEIFRVDVDGLRKHADFGSSVDGWGTNCGTSMLQPWLMDSFRPAVQPSVWSMTPGPADANATFGVG
jgi:hypothetical protein